MTALPMPEDGCACHPHDQDAGGGYTEHLLEYEPACPVHSHHVWDPTQGMWVDRPRPTQIQTVDAAVLFHRMDRLIGEAEAAMVTGHVSSLQVDAMKRLREALRLPPGSGGTGAQAALDRAYTGQPRARWGPPGSDPTP